MGSGVVESGERYHSEGWTVRGLNPGRGNLFYPLQMIQTGCGAHSASYSLSIGVLSRG